MSAIDGYEVDRAGAPYWRVYYSRRYRQNSSLGLKIRNDCRLFDSRTSKTGEPQVYAAEKKRWCRQLEGEKVWSFKGLRIGVQ